MATDHHPLELRRCGGVTCPGVREGAADTNEIQCHMPTVADESVHRTQKSRSPMRFRSAAANEAAVELTPQSVRSVIAGLLIAPICRIRIRIRIGRPTQPGMILVKAPQGNPATVSFGDRCSIEDKLKQAMNPAKKAFATGRDSIDVS